MNAVGRNARPGAGFGARLSHSRELLRPLALDRARAPQAAARAFANIKQALELFAFDAGIAVTAIVPVSAQPGSNVVAPEPGWCGYRGPSLPRLLERLPVAAAETGLPFSLPVQRIEKPAASADPGPGRRILWGRVTTGSVQVGQPVSVMPGGHAAVVAQVLDHARQPAAVAAGRSAGLLLGRELDLSRGDWLPAHGDRETPFEAMRTIQATVAWLADEPMTVGRTNRAVHGHRWVKARVTRTMRLLDVHTLARNAANQLASNAIGEVEIALQAPIAVLPYRHSRALGALVLAEVAAHRTAAAALVH